MAWLHGGYLLGPMPMRILLTILRDLCMPSPYHSIPGTTAKLCVSLALGAICSTLILVNPEAHNPQAVQKSWDQLWGSVSLPTSSATTESEPSVGASADPMPTITAGTKYYAVSKNAQGKDDLEFDKKVTSFIETSQARLDLFVATLESNPARAKSCANTLEGAVCQKLNSIMTDAVTSLDQAELAIESYQAKGVVADPVLIRLQKQVQELKKVAQRYPGIGPKVEL